MDRADAKDIAGLLPQREGQLQTPPNDRSGKDKECFCVHGDCYCRQRGNKTADALYVHSPSVAAPAPPLPVHLPARRLRRSWMKSTTQILFSGSGELTASTS